MSTSTTRTTLYLDTELRRALRLKAAETSRSMSDLVNDALRAELAEDAADLATFEKRKKGPTVSFEDFVKGLKRDGKL